MKEVLANVEFLKIIKPNLQSSYTFEQIEIHRTKDTVSIWGRDYSAG
jgi:hypothetical protein